MSDTDQDQADLDQAILSRDQAREAYVLQRLRTRRKMAMLAFAQFMFLGAGIIILGLWITGMAERIDHMGTFLSIYFGTLATIVMAYWGIGAYERNSTGSFMSTTTQVGYSNGGSSPFPAVTPPHPTLTKTPRSAS